MNENESSNHKRILTIQDVPSDIKVSQAQNQSPDANHVSRANITPDAEVSRAHESPFVGVPVFSHRDLDTRAAPSTALPFTGNICAFPKSPDISVSRAQESLFVSDPVSAQRELVTGVAPSTAPPIEGNNCVFSKSSDIPVSQVSEPFVGIPVSILQDLGTRVTPSIALPHAGNNYATDNTSLAGESAPQNGKYQVVSPGNIEDADASGKDGSSTKEHTTVEFAYNVLPGDTAKKDVVGE